MAMAGSGVNRHNRHSDKEPEWSSTCKTVFDQYLEGDDPFGFEPRGGERSGSDDSGCLFQLSPGSEQSNQMMGTVSTSLADPGFVEAEQPRSHKPVDFWTKTLRALEQNAAESERKQHTLRMAKSQPDICSPDGWPSPPAIPPSPTDQSFSALRRKSRGAANSKKAPRARSVSRGRPTGVTKIAESVNPYASVRKCSASPTKIMSPSCYQAGLTHAGAENVERTVKKHESRTSPPPLSMAARHPPEGFAAFGGSPTRAPLPARDGRLSQLTNTFERAHICTPVGSPAVGTTAAAVHQTNDLYSSNAPPQAANHYALYMAPMNNAAHLSPGRASSLNPSKIQAFDFGFSTAPSTNTNLFQATPSPKLAPAPNCIPASFPFEDPFTEMHHVALPANADYGLTSSSLSATCDPSLIARLSTGIDCAAFPTACSAELPVASLVYEGSREQAATAPSTPRRRPASPSPPATESRARRSSPRPRRPSTRRRTKSTNGTPRASHDVEQGGFVNFTPQDSTKILNGVAPSGSSRTRARREREAADKQRRLNQAAIRAVVEAGGDLGSLAEAGLLP